MIIQTQQSPNVVILPQFEVMHPKKEKKTSCPTKIQQNLAPTDQIFETLVEKYYLKAIYAGKSSTKN